MSPLYERINIACTAQGITPSGLCTKLGIRKSVLSDLKHGRSSSIRTDTIVIISEALGVSTDYLLKGAEALLKPIESQLLIAWRLASDTERQNVAFILREYGMSMPETREERSVAV